MNKKGPVTDGSGFIRIQRKLLNGKPRIALTEEIHRGFMQILGDCFSHSI